MATATKKPWTAEELCRLPEGWRYEIDEGELVIIAPAGWRHAELTNWVAYLITRFVSERRLGKVLSGEPGVHLRRGPDTLRAPDVAFYSKARAARVGNTRGFPEVSPDLAVEVHDPSEPELGRKVRQYLESGVRAVWVIDPEARTLTRHAPGEKPRTWSAAGEVVEEPVLPGFACRLAELFGEE